jgi:rubrerythrin
MTRMLYPNDRQCAGATAGNSGRSYDADRQGFINADPSDVKTLKAGGYIEAGGMPKVGRYWRCDKCNWDSNLNHCPKCDSHKLKRVVK